MRDRIGMRIGRRAGLGATLALGMAAGSFGQSAPPAELLLQGKVRDFVEDNPTVAPSHPHFLGTKPNKACSAQEFGVDIVAQSIDTTDDAGDTSVFKGDNRGPRLVAPLDSNVAPCFAPPARFADWYNDRTAGDVNRAFLIDIRFTRNDTTGLYEYFNDDFFPLDSGKAFKKLGAKAPYGHLLPPPNNGHDFGFTMEFHANFTYFKGKKQVFSFRGDDDVWVFVNGKKAIELGGIHPAQDAAFNLDSIASSHGLVDSLVYPLDFFFAERHVVTSKLRITTSLELEPQTSRPVLTAGGYFEGTQVVTVSHPAAGAVFYYTTDGSVPTVNSQKYAGPITVSATTTVRVIAVRPGYRPSDPVEAVYTRMETVAVPKADPPGRTFADPILISLSDSTPGAVIRYTLDGSDPDSTAPIYTAPIPIGATTTVKARAYLANWVPSAVMVEYYTDAATLPLPVAVPGLGTFVTSVSVELSVPGHPSARIHYTLDGGEPSESDPLYEGPISLTATTTLKARAFEAGLHPSPTLLKVYERLAASLKAVYTDADGDGRIDGALIHLDIAVPAVPPGISLADPFTRFPMQVAPDRMGLSADGRTLTALFPDRPFSPGTAFATADLGGFSGSPGFAPQPFAVSDSAGPVPMKAVSHNKPFPEANASVDVTFSEPIDLASLRAGPRWPFAIIRGGSAETRKVEVSEIGIMPGQANTYRFIFTVDSPAYPVYTDSLELAVSPLVRDIGGAAGVPGGKRIPVEGGPMNVSNIFEIVVTNPIVSQKGDFLPASAETRSNPFAVVGSDASGNISCLDCRAGSARDFLDGEILPEWIVRSRYPFHYSFSIFDHLGDFVASISGEVTPAMMGKIAREADGLRSARFRWKPIASDGNRAGTGAYILKGQVRNLAGETQKGSQGEAQVMTAAQKMVLTTFGYLRQRP